MTSSPSKLFINGESCRSTDGESISQINPATEEVIAEVSAASLADVHTAVKGAQKAFVQVWRDFNAQKRADLLFAIAGAIREHAEPLAKLECRNVGKPISDARREAALAARVFEYYAGAISKFGGQTIPVGAGGYDFTLRQPMGVVAVIVPWSYPLLNSCVKAAPALAAGNTVVLKPASRACLSPILLGQIAHLAGLPAGAWQIIPGNGAEIGDALVSHPQVRKIAFTGSTEVGAHLMVRAARDLKRVSLELGGKSPNIVFADADVERAAAESPLSVFGNAGQNCFARSRIFVESTVYDRFVARFIEATQKLEVGNPAQKTTQIGPLIAAEQRQSVEAFINEAREAGRKLALGGGRPFEKGFFLAPTVFLDVETSDRIWKEEIFGPVVCIRAFDGENEMLEEVNNSTYALSGSIWTGDLKRALRVAARIEGGAISINSHDSLHLEAPFGGCKHSGIGRQFGMTALEEYTELKNIYLADS
jgi:acyl-CoA reductase-like NAD-dependent aldehyde dehydrogenase